MDIDLLNELQQARDDKRQVVLATNITSGMNTLLFRFETNDESVLLAEAREALNRDKPKEI